MPGKTIGYIRVSTIDQNPERQLEGMHLDKKFVDYASGKSRSRPQLDLMMSFVREDDIVIVDSMDRLARSLRDLHDLLDYMLEKKVSVQFVKENLLFKDKSNHISNLMLNMMGSFAEFEYSIIKERVIEGVKIAKAAGKYKGGTCKLTPHTKEVLTELIKTRKSKRQMAFELGVTLKTLLKYMRMMGYGDMIGPPRILKPGQVVGENSNYRDTWRGENNEIVSHGA